MRQEGSRAAAPLNLGPKWPEGYLAILREAGAIEKRLPCYVDWVRRCFARHPGRRRAKDVLCGAADNQASLDIHVAVAVERVRRERRGSQGGRGGFNYKLIIKN